MTAEAWKKDKGCTIANREAWVYETVDLRAHCNVTGAFSCSMSASTDQFLRSDRAVLPLGGGHPLQSMTI